LLERQIHHWTGHICASRIDKYVDTPERLNGPLYDRAYYVSPAI
jgi:hypothetical protein